MLIPPSAVRDQVLADLDAPTDVVEQVTIPMPLAQCPTLGAGSVSEDLPIDPVDPLIDTDIGNYRIVRWLGAGGGGVVYEAVHRHLDRRVAIKLLRDRLANDPECSSRFHDEAIAAASIGHPSVVSVLDYGYDRRGIAYLVMEFVEGQSLQQVLRNEPLELSRAVEIAARIASTMDAAHRAGVVHRDLKPSNILVGTEPDGAERIKVFDFGVAKLVDHRRHVRPDRTRTGLGTVLGTPLYMSPEQVVGARTVDHRSDIYSLGCLLFELVCGFVPFSGRAADVLMSHLQRSPETPSRMCPNIPAQLDALVLAMLAKDPAARPPTMAAVAAALERIGRTLGPRPVPRDVPSALLPRRLGPHRVAPTVIRRRATEPPVGGDPAWSTRLWLRAAAAAAVAVALVAAAAAL